MSLSDRELQSLRNQANECQEAADEIVCLRERIRVLREALLVAQTALAEVAHAQSAGANWYTRGASGLYQQVAMWVRKGREAIGAALEATND